MLESIAAAFPKGCVFFFRNSFYTCVYYINSLPPRCRDFSFDFWASEDAKSLLRLMLCLNAQNRAAITELLRHPYVRTP